MSRQPYPLEVLRKLRDERAEAVALSLATHVARSERAAAELNERGRARREQQARTEVTLLAERQRVAQSEASGADLLRLTEFEHAARLQAGALSHTEELARQALASARAEEQKVRDQLAKLEAEAQLVRNHEARFHERHAEQRAKADEEAALEQWSARRH